MKLVLSFALTCLVLLVGACMESSDDLLGGCERVREFQVYDQRGNLIWQIQTNAPREICSIHYGTVPAAFVQVVPPSGSPRLLHANERVFVQRTTGDRFVRHDCSATSGRSVACAGYI